ncbi:chromo domain-containing protein 1 [Phialemonium atrogriseum]|uniref:Chromo domain-containing protein 1 n=1 Tax=Phialemonium atrogriseum TaxID=1093897 RepID=A0AAJ0CAD4_9PEZI|nr:chromo domain-containing protein 1 [Phialemonium atrogriseum]KAK1772906.1 chromo domain-containing protein 1 [Phialemonium atrogriseum]
MFKSLSRRGSSDQRSQATPEEDDDAVSVTSTASFQHDSDEEFEVANVLAEKTSNGATFYLVEWAGFSLDECTWEPASNLGTELREMWEETKQKQQRGEESPFNLQGFYDAVNKRASEKQERHRRRNAKRKRLGLKLTKPFSDNSGDGKDTTSDNDASDEAEEDDYVDTKVDDAVAAERGEPKQRISNIPGPKPAQVQRSSHTAAAAAAAAAATTPTKITTTSEIRRQSTQGFTVKAPPAPSTKATPTSKTSRSERPSLTGYQGTAKKLMTKSTTAGTNGTTATVGSSNPLNAAAVARGTVPGRTLQAAGRRVFTAKKSGAATKATPGNVFISGSTRKPRTTLKDAMTDSAKEQRLFHHYRTKRIADKGSRGREDRAPDLQALSGNLFEISKGPSSRKISKEGLSKEGQGRQEKGFRPSLITSDISIQDGQAKKKRKSVRFLSDEDGPLHSEPMDLDAPVGIDFQTPQSLSFGTGANHPSVDSNNRLGRSRSADKCLKFGPNTGPVAVTIYGLPLEPEEPWLTQFLAQDIFDCYYSCFAKTFSEQMNHIRQRTLCAGTIKSKESEDVLEAVAAHLRAGILGLYYSHSEYNLIIYPPRCDEWKWLADSFAAEPSSSNEGALRYFVFSSASHCGPFLRPIDASPMVLDEETPSPPPGRVSLVEKLLGLKYVDILPRALAGGDSTHNFFLAFPRSKGDLLHALFHWLRACKPDCRIYTSDHAGGWSAFRSAVEQQPGVVIVHELVSWTLHRFPSLEQYLNQKHDVYWCLSEASHSRPIFPSSALPEETVAPGKISFTPLFPHRSAILVTPSFLTSEPQRSFELLDWVLSNWTGDQQVKLLSGWDLRGYLAELAHEKSQARDVILQQPLGIAQKEINANLKGLSQVDCEDRFKALLVATELHNLRVAPSDSFALSEEASILSYADPSIDPNDEQSLVNWFGWWSSLRMDQFRGFHVVGSSQAMKYRGSSKGVRIVRIPKYTRCTINDADIVMDTVQQKYEPVEPQALDNGDEIRQQAEDQAVSPTAAVRAPVPAAVPVVVPVAAPVKPWKFESLYLSRESWAHFKQRLTAFGEEAAIHSPFMTVFVYPVSWTDSNMAQYFRDPHEEFRTMRTWFNFTWSFVHPPTTYRARKFNTYVGFFYTIADEWDPENPSLDPRPQRHPWLAIYRPVKPYLRPYKKCELIIWDLAAKEMFPADQVPRENELIYAQRYLIQLIREIGPVKNPGTWLGQVWLGGFQQPTISDSSFPVDITLDFAGLLTGAGLRDHLPILEEQMVQKGYKLVTLGDDLPMSGDDAEDASPPPQRMEIDLLDMDNDDDDDASEDEDSRIIFHPPRGRKLPMGYRGKCNNRLYEEASLARAKAPGSESYMLYEFQHTLEWYEEQKAEGRGYEHINVASWEAIFNTFRIGSAARPSSSGAELKESAVAKLLP